MSLFDYNGAEITPDGLHRLSLWRIWDISLPKVTFIGINPSTADATHPDNTITRCKNFALSWGYGGFYMANLYTFRTKDIRVLKENIHHAIHEDCELWLHIMFTASNKIICSWGSWNFTRNRADEVKAMIKEPYCLEVLKDGNPKHPLFCKANLKPIPYK